MLFLVALGSLTIVSLILFSMPGLLPWFGLITTGFTTAAVVYFFVRFNINFLAEERRQRQRLNLRQSAKSADNNSEV